MRRQLCEVILANICYVQMQVEAVREDIYLF